MSKGLVYLIPCPLAENANDSLPAANLEAVKDCQFFFVENERSARRFLKSIWKEMVIDDYGWYTIHKAEQEVKAEFRALLKEGKHIGIISEAGCPGIADPGQVLVEEAQKLGAVVKPLTGPNSILLALMASGMNGQQFCFHGYLPVEAPAREKAIRELEAASRKSGAAQIFIETPYRNNPFLDSLIQVCQPSTRICIACNLTAADEWIRTLTVADWKKQKADLHKKPAIFILQA